MRWLPSILAFKTYYPDSPPFGIFDTSEMIIVLAPEHIKSSLYLVNPSTFNVSDWYASSSWPSYCWSLISSTSYSSTSPKVPFWCMNPYDMPTWLVEIKEVDVELHLIILSTVDTDIGPFLLFATTATHGPLSSYAPSSSFSSSCYHCYHYHRCHCNVAVYVNYPTTTLSLAEGGRHQVDFKLGGLCSSPLKGPTLGPTLPPTCPRKGPTLGPTLG